MKADTERLRKTLGALAHEVHRRHRYGRIRGMCVLLAPGAGDEAPTVSFTGGTTCFAVLNIFPYNNGHLMVVPYRHTADFSDLPA